MNNKIAIIGTFGVGKTTLLNELAKLPEFKDYHIVRETAREYLETHKLDINTVNADPELLYQFQKNCLKNQWQEEQHDKFLSDRSVYDSLAYSELGLSDDKMTDLLAEIDIGLYKYDVILYIPIEYPMSQADIDDNRSPDEDYRARVDVEIFAQAVAHFPVTDIYTITGTVEERVKQVLQLLNKINCKIL